MMKNSLLIMIYGLACMAGGFCIGKGWHILAGISGIVILFVSAALNEDRKL
jgi:hypothetical protein